MKNMKVKVTAAALALVCAASSATAISVFANDSHSEQAVQFPHRI